jgi:ankyrin repeat protein
LIEALIDAARAGDRTRVRAIVAEDPRLVHARLPSGESPLMTAIYHRHTAVATALVELGTELDVFASAALGHLEGLTRALRQPEAAHAYAYDGWTPLHLAAFFGHLDAARMLLDAGADLAAVSRNSMKNTPLHAAVAAKHERIAVLLLERGADPNAVDGGGYTPVKIAQENQLSEFLKLKHR